MADFPKLKTGAVTQYPSGRRFEGATTVLQFVDGGEQRWRERGMARRSWVLRLSELDDREAAALADFFEVQDGRAGHFSFEDPWDGGIYEDCSFDQDEMEMECFGEGRWSAIAKIRENK